MVSLRPVSPMLSSPILAIICAFFFFSSTALAASAVLGVDLGTEYIKAALVKPGIPLEIVLTKDSRRKEMSAVAFKPLKKIEAGAFPERLYGSDAVALSARFPGDVYPNLKTLLGLPADNTLVKEWASRHPALQLEKDKTRGTAAFKSSAFTTDEESWTVEEILAMELQSIQKNAEALAGKGSTVKDLVITVPPFYTAEEKRAVILAAELAGLRVLELVSDGLAVGLNYATTRTFPSINEGGAPEYHLVFDMGAGSTKATILKFQGRTVKDIGKFNKTIQEVVVLGSGWDRTLGGDALNAIIVDDMVAKFVETPAAQKASTTVEAVKGHGRAVAKLWKEAERLRQVLSANANTQASFEGLYEDIDFKYKLTRAEFEKMAESHTARISETIEKALAAADHMEPAQLDSIILHGGAVRTPFVQKELEKFIGKADKVRSNVNSDEAAVFGAGFRGATLSPSFRVKEIRALEAANYASGIKWINLHDKPQHQRLWQPASILGSEKQYSFKNQKEFDILFYQHVPSSENVSPGSAEKELLKIITTNLTDSVNHVKDTFNCENKDIHLKLSTRLSPTTGEVEILKFFVECELEETEEAGSVMDGVKGLFGFGKKDQVPLAEGEEGVETETISASDSSTSTSTSSTTSSSTSSKSSASASAKESKAAKDQKTKKRIIEVNVKYDREIRGTPQLPKAELARMKDRISAFEDSDRSQKLREEALNQLEGFTYRARDLLDNEEFIAASTEAERASLEAKSKEASDWIYSGGADASREELKARLNAMKDIVSPIEIRRDEAAARPAELKKLHDALNQTKSFIEGVKGQIKDDEEKASSFSASKAAASTETPSPSASVEDDFAGLEDDDSTTTTSSVASEPTLDPPTYTVEDLKAPQALYDSVSIWLEEKLAAQEKLPPTADPVIFVKDISLKAKQLQDVGVELLMKSMKKPKPNTKKPTTSKKAKTTKSKSKKSAKGESTSTVSGHKAKKTPDFEKMNFGDSDIPIFKVGEDGDMPLEEEILAAMKAQKAKFAEDEKKAKAADEEKKPVKEAKEEKEEKEGKKEHVIDEL